MHGVRVFADLVPGVLVDTEPGAMEALLKLEAAAAELAAFHSRGHSFTCSVRHEGPRGLSHLVG